MQSFVSTDYILLVSLRQEVTEYETNLWEFSFLQAYYLYKYYFSPIIGWERDGNLAIYAQQMHIYH